MALSAAALISKSLAAFTSSRVGTGGVYGCSSVTHSDAPWSRHQHPPTSRKILYVSHLERSRHQDAARKACRPRMVGPFFDPFCGSAIPSCLNGDAPH